MRYEVRDSDLLSITEEIIMKGMAPPDELRNGPNAATNWSPCNNKGFAFSLEID